MSFAGMPAALETDPFNRLIKLVFALCDAFGQPEVKCNRRAREILAAIEQEFTSVKMTGPLLRKLIDRCDDVSIGNHRFDPERHTIECVMRVGASQNFDSVYDFIVDVLEKQPHYEPRGARAVFTQSQEDAIEAMPKEDTGVPAQPTSVAIASDAARETLYRYLMR